MNRGTGKNLGLIGGTLLSLTLLILYNPVPEHPEIGRMAAVAVLMAVFWITEALPLAATSLIPIVAFPLLGISDTGVIAKSYVNSIIFLFLGGFLIALAMQRWDLHKRIALNIIHLIGRRADFMVLGFMVAAAFLSMWISNTATAVMMLPIGLAIVVKMEEAFGVEKTHGLTLALLLGIAYACSIGGVATLVGTPPNLVFIRIFQEMFPEAEPLSFGNWLIIGIPYAAVLLVITWFLLTRLLCRFDKNLALDRSVIEKELRDLGPIRTEEKRVLAVFLLTVFLWTFRRDLELGVFTLPGWSGLWDGFRGVDDGTIAISMALLLFILPASRDSDAERILQSDVFAKLPWAIILLFGGGFALATGFTVSGLSQHLGELFQATADIPIFVQMGVICLSVTFLTELTSNTATTSMLLPILTSWAVSLEVHPLLFAIPATISASMAFMMPVATPPNAVIFGSQRIRIIEMVRCGLFLNLIAFALTMLFVYLLFPLVAGAPIDSFPDWAK